MTPAEAAKVLAQWQMHCTGAIRPELRSFLHDDTGANEGARFAGYALTDLNRNELMALVRFAMAKLMPPEATPPINGFPLRRRATGSAAPGP